MKTVLSTILMLLIWIVPLIIKAKKEKAKASSAPRPTVEEDEEADYGYPASEMGAEFQNSERYASESQEYFTYESDDSDEKKSDSQQQTTVNKGVQIPEIEQEPPVDLTFDKEEMLKGVIYSEILKRKGN